MKVHYMCADDMKNNSADYIRYRKKGVSLEESDVVVVFGGDGFMLHVLHTLMDTGKKVYGVNAGSLGFLLNEPSSNIEEKLKKAVATRLYMLKMEAQLITGEIVTAPAFNEVSLFRATHQAAKLDISIDDKVVMKSMVGDGILVATPAGSTAYNFSAHGPILPMNANVLAVTPISPFRPRRWRGAIIPQTARVNITVCESEKRPVNVVADSREFAAVKAVSVQHTKRYMTLLFDPEHSLEKRVFLEQFHA